jgi:hypothetical protein
MPNYRFSLTQEAAEWFAGAPAKMRRRALDLFRRLAAFPERQEDARIADDEGQPVLLVHESGLLITYWVDHAVCEVRIVEIEEL